jgi:tRNA pseudouridine55 synthase
MPSLDLPTGTIRQRPPAYSAVKVGGQRAYALARRGEEVQIPEREVQVSRFDLVWRDGDRAGFEIECSSGTYVRSLIADLGDAYCLELRRTAIGPFDVAQADDEGVIPLDHALAFMPAIELKGEPARRAAHGRAIPFPPTHPRTTTADGPVRLRDEAGLIALAEPRGDGTLKPIVGFRG